MRTVPGPLGQPERGGATAVARLSKSTHPEHQTAAKAATSCSLKDPRCNSADLPHYTVLTSRRWHRRM